MHNEHMALLLRINHVIYGCKGRITDGFQRNEETQVHPKCQQEDEEGNVQPFQTLLHLF